MELTQEQLDVLSLNLRHKRLRIELLNDDLKTIDSIEGLAIGGSITANADNDIRRSGNVQMVIQESSFTGSFLNSSDNIIVDPNGKIWLDKCVKIFVGIDNINSPTQETVWNNLGVFLIDQPVKMFSSTEYTISFDCIDQMAKLTGLRQGQLTGITTIIEKGSIENINNGEVLAYDEINNKFLLYNVSNKAITEQNIGETLDFCSFGEDAQYVYILLWSGKFISFNKKTKEYSTLFDIAESVSNLTNVTSMSYDDTYFYFCGFVIANINSNESKGRLIRYNKQTNTFVDAISFPDSGTGYSRAGRKSAITNDADYVYVSVSTTTNAAVFAAFSKTSSSFTKWFYRGGSSAPNVIEDMFQYVISNTFTRLFCIVGDEIWTYDKENGELSTSWGIVNTAGTGYSFTGASCSTSDYMYAITYNSSDTTYKLYEYAFDLSVKNEYLLPFSGGYGALSISADDNFVYIYTYINKQLFAFNRGTKKINTLRENIPYVFTRMFAPNSNAIIAEYVKTKLKDTFENTLSELAGIKKYSVYQIPEINEYLPYDIKIGIGSTVYDILKELMNLLPTWQMYFDTNGVFRIEPIPSGENDTIYPIEFEQLISDQTSYDFQNVKNQVVVYGRCNNLTYYTDRVIIDEEIGFGEDVEVSGFVQNSIDVDENNVYCAGYLISSGRSNGKFVVYNKVSKTFGSFVESPISWISGVSSYGGVVFCIGDDLYSQPVCSIYNKNTKSFGELVSTPFTISPSIIGQNMVNVYLANSVVGSNNRSEFSIFNKNSNTFSDLLILPNQLVIDRSAFYEDYIYFVGFAYAADKREGQILSYNTKTGEFGEPISIPQEIYSGPASITVDDKNIFILTYNGKFCVYDKIQNIWSFVLDVDTSSVVNSPLLYNDDRVVFIIGGTKFYLFDKVSKEISGVYSKTDLEYFSGARLFDDILYLYSDNGFTTFNTQGEFSLYYNSLNTSSFTVSGTTFGFLMPKVYNEGYITKVNIYNNDVLLGNFQLVGFENSPAYLPPHQLKPSEIYFIRIYSAPMSENGNINFTEPSQILFEFMGKQQVSYALVTDNVESPFYINKNLPEPNYYAGLAYGTGENYLLTLNNKEPLNGLADKSIITFMANYLNEEGITISIKDASGNILVEGLPIVQNYWDASISPAIRPPIQAYKMDNDYTIWEVQYDSTNNWFVLLGRNPKVLTQVFSGGEYDNIYADQLAYERCLYELFQHSNMQNSVTLGIVPNYVLDVNCKIPYSEEYTKPSTWDKPFENISYYITKQITYPLGLDSTPQTVSAIQIYDSGNLVGNIK